MAVGRKKTYQLSLSRTFKGSDLTGIDVLFYIDI